MKVFGIKSLLLVSVVCFFYACADDDSRIKAKDVAGFYGATLPCADCAEIDFNLILRENKTFISSMNKVGSNAGLELDSGKFKLSDGRLVLKSSVYESEFYYDLDGLNIVAATQNGDARTGTDKKDFTLFRIERVLANKNAVLESKFIHQNYFFAQGDDWYLTLDKDLNAHLKIAEETFQFQFPKHVTDLERSTKTWVYVSEVDSVFLELKKQPCVGGGFNGTEVNLAVNMKKRTGCATFLSPLFNLNKKWNLITVNGETLPEGSYSKGRPMIDIDVLDRTFVGNTCCNYWKGGAKPNTHEIQFRPGVMTRMICAEGQEFETFLIQSFGRLWKYELVENELRLSDGEETMVFVAH